MFMRFKVAVVEWSHEECGLPQVIYDELSRLGHSPIYFPCDTEIPQEAQVILTFGPYGDFLGVGRKLSRVPIENRPIWAHWNTEGIPDLLIPWVLVKYLSALRSSIGRLATNDNKHSSLLQKKLLLPWNDRVLRYRYVGDYYYAYRKGLLNVYSDSSEIFAQIHSAHGLPTVVAPWGATPKWYNDLNLERDLDVLWMGQRGSNRRSQLLDRVREELRKFGVEMHVADNLEKPFIYDKERTEYLNRAKITLNLTRTWFDDNFSRFAMAAPNKSLIVSEPMLPHCPRYIAGRHYVSAKKEKLAETILYYLHNEDERIRITDDAYQLVTTELAFQNSIRRIMNSVRRVWEQKSGINANANTP
jgi:hypothetical protein